jgi:hypothetical protein
MSVASFLNMPMWGQAGWRGMGSSETSLLSLSLCYEDLSENLPDLRISYKSKAVYYT